MATKYPHTIDRRWRASVLVGLLIALTAWTRVWPLSPPEARLHVAVHEGQISVDVREAPVREVLAAIGQQAGLLVLVDTAANRSVNAQFTGMELDQGLRRLLRAASLNYSLLYTRGPAATVILQEVRVFGEAPAGKDWAPSERAQRAAAPSPSLPQEEPPELEPTELEQDVEPEAWEPAEDEDATQD
jgi:type II secretory pathway component GspD/PulD (secretin)